MSQVLVSVKGLKQYFSKDRTVLKAVDDVSFDINTGETLGMVGESGSGKSTCARAVLRLNEPTDGQVLIDGEDVCRLNPRRLREVRKKMQIVFQDPLASLPPHMPVGQIVAEPLRIHGIGTPRERQAEAMRLLEMVGVPTRQAGAYPHEFSGGQQQRIGIARALALKPKFIVLDEPVSALDVSIQAQILNLLDELQRNFGLTYLFIAHNLAVVKHISTRVAVMYLGRIMEIGPTADMYLHPAHPYTQALLSAVPRIRSGGGSDRANRIVLSGEVPSPLNPPQGCRFSTRCWLADERCKTDAPELKEISPGHQVACHRV
ncbi:MAG: ABC transporter ATP-binding protein [Chitinophagales bacterium]